MIMEKDVLYFLNCLEGYHSILKTIHWSTSCKSEHLLTDEIDSSILKFEDRIAEAVMGITGNKIEVGTLKTLMPSSKNLTDTLDELTDDVISIMNKIGDNKEHCGMINILEEFMESIATWKYLSTLK